MKWVCISDRIHAVARAHNGLTLCGLEIERVKSIAHAPGFENRCLACDREWRHRGRAQKPPVKKIDARTVYRPQYTFADFEGEI